MSGAEKAKDSTSTFRRVRRFGADRTVEIWESLFKNNLWKRILKNTVCTTALGTSSNLKILVYQGLMTSNAVSICLIPGSKTAIGKAAYLGATASVFGHPGRRFGQMAEALILAVSGTVLGVAWSTLGLYLGSLVVKDNPPAAYTIRASFLMIATLLHGYLRSRAPRLFIFVLLMIISSVVTLTSTATAVTTVGVTQILYPMLIAVGIAIVVNISLFPEFSSRFLGQTTIDTLDETAKALEDAGNYFIGLPQMADDAGEPVESMKKAPESMNDISHEFTKAGRGPNRSQSRESHVQDGTNASFFLRHFERMKGAVYSQTSAAAEQGDVGEDGLKVISISELTASKSIIRKKMSQCKEAQNECNFELAVSVLPPHALKEISTRKMKKLVANVIAVVGACESRYALLGEAADGVIEGQPGVQERNAQSAQKKDDRLDTILGGRHALENLMEEAEKDLGEPGGLHSEKSELEQIKPRREIEFGDARLLEYLLERISKPYQDLHLILDRTIEVVSACIAYVYDVPVLPSGAKAPTGIALEELDVYIDAMKEALANFDTDAASALDGASIIQGLGGEQADVMPREEVFLISSFLLNLRQAAQHIQDMLGHSRQLVEHRQARHGRIRVYAPRIKWASWLSTGSEEVEALPSAGRKANRKGEAENTGHDDADGESLDSTKSLLSNQSNGDVENITSTRAVKEDQKPNARDQVPSQGTSVEARDAEYQPFMLKLRGGAADAVEWVQSSEDFLYAVKLTFAVFLVLWPAFVAAWNTWYSLNRGLWAALQLIIITEVSIGSAINIFLLRGIGTTLGCLWGWAAVEARDGNRIVCAVMVCIGIIPCAYVQLASKYPKAGMVAIISICVVSLASELETVPGTPTQNFLKRWIAFMIGGAVAILVEMVLLPVKARTRMVESLAAALRQINDMEKCLASGIEEGSKFDAFSIRTYERFEKASTKANTALTAAEMFLPFCSVEPRIKGSFKGLALIYEEILYVLHQIVDRMDNMLQLRTLYGSGPLEEFNADIYPYRRNVGGSITLTLYAIHGALTTKMALPQFLPSARLAHLRMIKRVREVVLDRVRQSDDSPEIAANLARQRAVRRKYVSWNAASAAQAEIIEFLEELIDLTKLLVGANEFRSGLLTRQTYLEYVAKGQQHERNEEKDKDKAEKSINNLSKDPTKGSTSAQPVQSNTSGVTRRRRGTTVSSVTDTIAGRRRRGTTTSSKSVQEDVPPSLKRIKSRKIEAGIQRQRANENWDQ